MPEQPQLAPVQLPPPPVTVATGIGPGPDGQIWVTVNIQYGLVVCALMLTEGAARSLAGLMGRDLVTAADAAKRAKLGLIVPGAPGGPAPNGKPATGLPPMPRS